MAIIVARYNVELREIALKNKPAALLSASSKGTVPVLVVSDQVIDQSLAIMRWALNHSVHDAGQRWDVNSLNHELIAQNDDEFKYWLDRYKYFDRYPEASQSDYLTRACDYLAQLEIALADNQSYLHSSWPRALDIAIFPFVRQFAHVDLEVFNGLPFPKLQGWFSRWMRNPVYLRTMNKYAVWQAGDVPILFG